MGESGLSNKTKAVTHSETFKERCSFDTFAKKVSASQRRSTGTRTEKRRRALTNKEDRNTAGIREEDGQDSARYLGGEAMLPDGGVGVGRGNGRESR